MIVSLLSFFLIIISFYNYDKYILAERTLRDAKNIQLAMRILSIEYLGKDREIFYSGSLYGMEKDTIEEIHKLSDSDGEITLISWDTVDNAPRKFYYQTDKYLVTFENDKQNDELLWKIYRVYSIK